MEAIGLALFDSPIGRCGIAWSTLGVVAVQLPEHDDRRTRARLVRRAPEAVDAVPSPEAQRAIDGILSLLAGKDSDLTSVTLDMDGLPPFHRRVYEAARTIPPGATRSYGDVAAELGDPAAARAVGQALGSNPLAILVPCHRVLAAGGAIGGFSAPGGVATKRRLLAIEGTAGSEQLALFDAVGGR